MPQHPMDVCVCNEHRHWHTPRSDWFKTVCRVFRMQYRYGSKAYERFMEARRFCTVRQGEGR
jgi:hypothetical protein